MADSNSKTFLSLAKKTISNQYFPIIILLIQLITYWTTWKWYFQRVVVSTDGFYGVLALVSVLLISSLQKPKSLRSEVVLPIVSLITLLFVVSYDLMPPLIRGVIAFTSVSCLISFWRFGNSFNFGIWSLFILSLPSIPTLQFFLGYPMRVLVGQITVFFLKLNGLSVIRDGVGLNFGDKTIWIDAPCSGIKMLWAGFFLTALLITLYRFNIKNSILAFIAAFLIILLGNIFRSTGLFYLEAEIIKMPSFAHEGIGVICFIFTCLGIVYVVQMIRKKLANEKLGLKLINFQKYQLLFLLIFLITNSLAFYIQTGNSQRINFNNQHNSVEFPKTFENKPIRELGLTEIEEYFMEDFPGIVKRFTDGEKEIIIRFVREATRKLHSPADCFAGNGYKVMPLPLKVEKDGKRWSCFSAQKESQNLKVCERIFTTKGEEWTDVSAWYWSALNDNNSGGYWTIVTAETISE